MRRPAATVERVQARAAAAAAAPAAVRLLGSLVVTAGLIVVLGVLLGVMLLVRSAQTQDRIVAEASVETFAALVALQTEHLARSVRDYAEWDEAIERLPGGYDPGWWEDNAGTYAIDGFGLSFSMAVDGSDLARFVTVAGEATTVDAPRAIVTPSLRSLLRAARAGGSDEASGVATGVVDFGGALHLAAAVGFSPERADSPANPDPGALLVFAYAFEDRVMAEAGAIMGVSDMRLVAQPPGSGASWTVAVAGTASEATVAWRPPRPGRRVAVGALVPFGATAVALVVLVGFFVVRARRLARDLLLQDRTRLRLAARSQSILEAAGDGIFGVDEHGVAVFVNPAALAATGYRLEEFLGVDPHELLGCAVRHGDDELCPIHAVLTHGRAISADTEEFVGANGRSFPVEFLASPVRQDDQVIGAVVVFRDITERRLAQEEMRRRANHDALTGLPNRSLIVERLDQAVTRARRTGTQAAVMFLDLDDFKWVNDAYGHDAGDRLLTQVGERLVSCVRAMDSVARLGGDEFLVLLTEVRGPRDASRVAEKVLAVLAEPFELDGRQARVDGSIGIALFPGDGEDAGELIRHADLAMYVAKRRGRHAHAFYRRALTAEALERRVLETDLRRALDGNELILFYLPVVGLEGGGVEYVEALLRWHHPERGLLLPSTFVPVAEEAGLMADLGTWALREACRQLAAWRAAGIAVDVAIHVSRSQVPRGLPVHAVASALHEHGVPADALLFEVDESVLLDREAPVAEWRRAVRELGIRLVLEDFGAGCSSLAHLGRHDLHALKIDRSFMADLLDSDASRTIVAAVLSMAEGLGLAVVAEGVETEAQADWLRDHGCRLAQGFALGRPRPPEGIADLLRPALEG